MVDQQNTRAWTFRMEHWKEINLNTLNLICNISVKMKHPNPESLGAKLETVCYRGLLRKRAHFSAMYISKEESYISIKSM